VLRRVIERLQELFSALLVGTMTDQFIDKNFYGLVVRDGVLVRVRHVVLAFRPHCSAGLGVTPVDHNEGLAAAHHR
jgi:hypothetical protein